MEILEGIANKYREGEGNIISLLQDTQEAFGCITREAINYFSEELGIPPSRLYGVATFYAQFRLKPAGRHIITACCGTACHVRGAERIISGLQRELDITENEDTTPDREFTLEKVACLGTCSFAPVALIDGNVRGKANLDTIVKEIKKIKKDDREK
ncbi:MAG: NAD(P)H-dependent oxidoreductase subunit E [Nitrospirae bacterium]|nr:NAD(P)H-dependent oxidoreductase subunit E [Nitrospirota bacterium]